MRWSPEPPAIGRRTGFDKTDIFGFRTFGERLANIVEAFDDDPVLLLDGPWGSGKTTFVAQWAGLLRDRGHAVLYLDAFAKDHYGEPFLALAEEVHRVATEENLVADPSLVVRFEKGTAAAAKELGFAALSLANPALGLVAEAVRTAATKPSGRSDPFRKWLEEASARRKAVLDFRGCLGELATECSLQAGREGRSPSDSATVPAKGDSRFVFIVDELDRCRPGFSVAMLERIKHIFGVRGVTFVLVANVAELGKSIQRDYGSIDPEKYLEKFYEMRVRLPEKVDSSGSFTSKRYVRHLARGARALEPRWKSALDSLSNSGRYRGDAEVVPPYDGAHRQECPRACCGVGVQLRRHPQVVRRRGRRPCGRARLVQEAGCRTTVCP